MKMIKLKREVEGKTISSLNLYILDNDDPSHDMRPFAVIENVRTESGYENHGLASGLIDDAICEARAEGCYKITLTTSSKKPNVAHLYKKMGFTDNHKTAWYQSLEN